MSYRRRMEMELERRQRRAMDEKCNRGMYYSHRLKFCEEILSRVFDKPVSLVVMNGWVLIDGKRYRVSDMEAYALHMDARLEHEDEIQDISGM